MAEKTKISPITAWLAVAAILAGAGPWSYFQFGHPKNIQLGSDQPASKEVFLVIDYGNGKVRKFGGPIDDSAKSWDLLQQAIAVSGIKVEVAGSFVPKVIDGFSDGKDGKHWSFYLNKQKQTQTPYEAKIKPGDEVMFRFE